MKKLLIGVFIVLSLAALQHGVQCQKRKGDLTYYTYWNKGFGSCGLQKSMENEFYVAALSRKRMQLPPGMTNPNNHPMCGPSKCVQVYGSRGSVVLKVSDTCWDCKENDVDVADTVFPLLEDPIEGRVKVSWKFVNCHSSPPGRR